MRSRPLVAALLSALLVAVASARGDRRLRAAVGAGDDDAVGDDDAAFQSNAGGGKSGGGGASPNPYLAQLHNQCDEPESKARFNFDFERPYLEAGVDMTKEELQRLLYAEMCALRPVQAGCR